ncbi:MULTISPECIES: entericidin [unclassified Sinorhizobium]|uniref:entericidin domain-containing protein n=1 Tax=unclassified Sinorhizobium TaxID=2613772 RepID=UPI0035235BA6
MTASTIVRICAACLVVLELAACANTIRGMGQDTANAVNATQGAGHRVSRAAR